MAEEEEKEKKKKKEVCEFCKGKGYSGIQCPACGHPPV
jgi:hypothetical protein